MPRLNSNGGQGHDLMIGSVSTGHVLPKLNTFQFIIHSIKFILNIRQSHETRVDENRLAGYKAAYWFVF